MCVYVLCVRQMARAYGLQLVITCCSPSPAFLLTYPNGNCGCPPLRGKDILMSLRCSLACDKALWWLIWLAYLAIAPQQKTPPSVCPWKVCTLHINNSWVRQTVWTLFIVFVKLWLAICWLSSTSRWSKWYAGKKMRGRKFSHMQTVDKHFWLWTCIVTDCANIQC